MQCHGLRQPAAKGEVPQFPWKRAGSRTGEAHYHTDSASAGLGRDTRFCTSNRCPGVADAASPDCCRAPRLDHSGPRDAHYP